MNSFHFFLYSKWWMLYTFAVSFEICSITVIISSSDTIKRCFFPHFIEEEENQQLLRFTLWSNGILYWNVFHCLLMLMRIYWILSLEVHQLTFKTLLCVLLNWKMPPISFEMNKSTCIFPIYPIKHILEPTQ